MVLEKDGGYEVVREGNEEVLKVDATSWPYTPSLEDNSNVMTKVVEMLVSSPGVQRIIFHQQKKFVYSYDQTLLLIEIAGVYNHLVKGKRILSIASWGFDELSSRFFGDKLGEIQYLVLNLLKGTP